MDLKQPVTREMIQALRTKKQDWDPDQPQGFLIEDEPDGRGSVVRTATYFLTGAECRFACAFCDLWKYTLDRPTPQGSLVRQIENLHERVAATGQSVQWLKLYNASNFFDTRSVPSQDLIPIAHACRGMERIIVENHASMLTAKSVQERVLEFASECHGELEIAMGLETIDPAAVPFLNKQLHRSEFESACEFLRSERIRTRAFVMLQPPGTRESESVAWAVKSCRYAFALGVERCGIVPTRSGNGWLDSLRDAGQWTPPNANQLEHVLRELLAAGAGTTVISGGTARSETVGLATVDLWDWEQVVGGCPNCRPSRLETLQQMNLQQNPIHRSPCLECES